MKKIFGAASGALLSFAGVENAFAQGTAVPSLPNPLNANDLQDAITKIIGALWVVAVPLSVVMVIVGAFQMMLAAGNPEKFAQGRKTIMYAAIGLIVLLLSGAVASVIQSIFA